MKKLLLGTTALATAALMGSQAMAADPIKVSIGGFYSGVAAFGHQDKDTGTGDKYRADTFKQDGEIWFMGETKLDNGLEVGFRVELEAFTSEDQVDEHYVWFKGGFGELQFGATNSVAYKMHVFIPTAVATHGVETPDYFHFTTPSFSSAALSSTAGDDDGAGGDANKISYFSPVFGGFQFGVSYTPEFTPGLNGNACGATGGSSISFGSCTKDKAGTWQHALAGALRYDGEFNDFGIAFSVGGLWADAESKGMGEVDYKRLASGLSLSFGDFVLGGAARWSNQGLAGKNDEWMYGVGGTYAWDNWTAGISWARVRDQDDGNKADKLDLIDGGLSYNLGPGIDLFGGAQWAKFTGDSGGPNRDGLKGYFGTRLTF